MTTNGISELLRSKLDRIQTRALLAGGVGLIISLVLGLVMPRPAMQSYLVAYLYFIGIALGCVSFLMLHNLTGGGWGAAIRRPMEAGGMTLIPLAVLFLPILVGAGAIYPWIHPDAHLAEALGAKLAYLNLGWFTVRAVVYFAVWIALAVALNRLSAAQDRTEDPRPTEIMQGLSGLGLVVLFGLASLAVIDWSMSLEPEWYSTIYPPLIIVGWGLTTFALMLVVVVTLIPYEPIPEVVTPSRIHDLGNLMLAFVMLWAYMAFSQFLIIWAGELSEEIPWYLRRSFGAWKFVAQLLILFHFAVPFFILLFRDSKRNARSLRLIAILIAVMHLVDLAWIVLPSQIEDPLKPHFTWLSLLALPFAVVGVGGLWLASFVWFLKRRDLVPARLPGLTTIAADPTLSGGH